MEKRPFRRSKKSFWERLWSSILESLHGAAYAFQGSKNLQILLPAAILMAVTLGVWLEFVLAEWLILAFCVVRIISTEAVNTSIEELNDLACSTENERVRKSKDMASFSVFVHNVFGSAILVFFAICHLIHWPWWQHLFGK